MADGNRRENDAYYTPDVLARACVDSLFRHGFAKSCAHGMEPSSGRGAFVRAMRAYVQHVTTMDIDPDAARGDTHYDGDFASLITIDRYGLIVGNPPFSEAESHVRRALGIVNREDGCVAFLLRLAFLESAERQPFWREFPATAVHTIVPRPSFTGGGTDSCAYGWFVWQWHAGALVRGSIDWITWDNGKRRKGA